MRVLPLPVSRKSHGMLTSSLTQVAATCLAFYLTLGLSVGSLLSFAVRGAICRCNPFL